MGATPRVPLGLNAEEIDLLGDALAYYRSSEGWRERDTGRDRRTAADLATKIEHARKRIGRETNQ